MTTTLDFRFNDSGNLAAFYTLATSEADGFVNRLGSLDLRCEGTSTAPRDLWREPNMARFIRRLLADMPALPVLISVDSPAALWLPMCMHDNGITVGRSERNADIELQVFERLFRRMAWNLVPLNQNLGLNAQQLVEVNAQLRELRHHLIEQVQNC